ncbi:MAG: hypothetical protein PHR95_13925 [Acidithiobacillus sp.]|nr:hypothetical protein [Acidithiobacillus sp.]
MRMCVKKITPEHSGVVEHKRAIFSLYSILWGVNVVCRDQIDPGVKGLFADYVGMVRLTEKHLSAIFYSVSCHVA